MTVVVEPRATSTPVPGGRGRWRLVAYQRQFSPVAFPVAIGQLDNARGVRLSRKLNTAAELTLTLDGHDPAAANLLELATDVIAFRWDETRGADVPMFRGLIDHSEDQLSEQTAVVTFTAHDYLGLMNRRIIWSLNQRTGIEQDVLAATLVSYATRCYSSSLTSFDPGCWFPIGGTSNVAPDGTSRAQSGQLRNRTWQVGALVGNELDNLAHVINGFDYDVLPLGPANAYDLLRIFYPQQGVVRSDVALVYGANVAALTRTVSSADYANYVRVIGNKGSADPAAAQLFSEQWNTDANNVTVTPVGLWQMVENASDVSVQSTLDDKARGDLGWYGALTPTYTLGLRAGAYSLGFVNMGDVVPLFVNEGRLAVNTTIRVVGIDYSIGDDGNEDVTLTVGRPPTTLARLLTASDRDIDALARR